MGNSECRRAPSRVVVRLQERCARAPGEVVVKLTGGGGGFRASPLADLDPKFTLEEELFNPVFDISCATSKESRRPMEAPRAEAIPCLEEYRRAHHLRHVTSLRDMDVGPSMQRVKAQLTPPCCENPRPERVVKLTEATRKGGASRRHRRASGEAGAGAGGELAAGGSAGPVGEGPLCSCGSRLQRYPGSALLCLGCMSSGAVHLCARGCDRGVCEACHQRLAAEGRSSVPLAAPPPSATAPQAAQAFVAVPPTARGALGGSGAPLSSGAPSQAAQTSTAAPSTAEGLLGGTAAPPLSGLPPQAAQAPIAAAAESVLGGGCVLPPSGSSSQAAPAPIGAASAAGGAEGGAAVPSPLGPSPSPLWPPAAAPSAAQDASGGDEPAVPKASPRPHFDDWEFGPEAPPTLMLAKFKALPAKACRRQEPESREADEGDGFLAAAQLLEQACCSVEKSSRRTTIHGPRGGGDLDILDADLPATPPLAAGVGLSLAEPEVSAAARPPRARGSRRVGAVSPIA